MSAVASVKSADADILGEEARLNPADKSKLLAADGDDEGGPTLTGFTRLAGSDESGSASAASSEKPAGNAAAALLMPQPAEDENQPGFYRRAKSPTQLSNSGKRSCTFAVV